jgi:3-oxoadipate enol-lactonase
MIAQELALAAPSRVQALVLAATLAAPDSSVDDTAQRGAVEFGLGKGGLDPQRLAMAQSALASGALSLKQIVSFLMPLILTPGYVDRERDKVRAFVKRVADNGFSVEGFMGQVAAVMAHDTRSRLSSVAAPTLVLSGSQDKLVPPHLQDELVRLIPGARLHRMEGAPHALNWEMADEFNRVTAGFLNERGLG